MFLIVYVPPLPGAKAVNVAFPPTRSTDAAGVDPVKDPPSVEAPANNAAYVLSPTALPAASLAVKVITIGAPAVYEVLSNDQTTDAGVPPSDASDVVVIFVTPSAKVVDHVITDFFPTFAELPPVIEAL